MARAKRSKRLQLVVDLAKRKREEADSVLRESRRRLDAAEQGLKQLDTYLQEYLEASRMESGQVVGVGQLQTQAAFIGRLRGSISQQQNMLSQARAQHQQVEKWWRELHARERAIEKLQKKAIDEEISSEEKQLQKQIDELSQRRPINFI